MIDNRLAEDIQLKLRPEHFFEPLHGRIYEQILRLLDRNMIASPVTLRPLFEADEEMKELGGPAYLAQLTGSGAAIIGARDFADQIYDLALLRALVGVGREMVEQALDTSEEVEPKGQIEEAEAALYRVAEEGGGEGSVKSFAQATRMAVQMAEKALNTGGGLSGITTGLETVNAKTGGLHHSRSHHPRRPPGHGQDRARHQHRLQRRPALSSATWRTASRPRNRPAPASPSSASKCRPTSSPPASSPSSPGSAPRTLRMGKISQQDFRNLARAAADLETLPLYIDDTPGLTIAALRTRARRLKRQKGIGLVVVDYLQLLQGTGTQLATTIASRRFRRSRGA